MNESKILESQEIINNHLNLAFHKRAFGLLEYQFERGVFDKREMHTYWKGICDAYGFNIRHQTNREGCSIINKKFAKLENDKKLS